MEKRMYSPKEVVYSNGGIINMSLSAVYAAMKDGKIPYKSIGKRKLIPYWFLEQLLEKTTTEN